MRRTQCSACGSQDLEKFLDLGTSPIADGYAATAVEARLAQRWPLEVATCSKCRLVQLLEVLDGEQLFGTGYSFYSSASPPLSAYHATYAAGLLSRYALQAAQGVLEVGCNDGDMLRHFAHLPHVGVDPAQGPIGHASAAGLTTVNEAFGFELARKIGRESCGLLIANHVLAHVADVSDVIAGIAHVLRPNGVAVIEVQYLPDLLVNNAFDLVYHEHRNFFSLTTLEHALRRHGLSVVDVQLTDRQGGSLRVAAKHHTRSRAYFSALDGVRQSEAWLNSYGAYEGMQGRAERVRDRLIQMIDEARGEGRVVALYGAPAKATTLLNFCGLTEDDLSYCWDSTPAKQGRYIPGTGIEIRPDPVISSEGERPDVFLLAAWNYLRPIIKAHPGYDWIVPFPAPMALS